MQGSAFTECEFEMIKVGLCERDTDRLFVPSGSQEAGRSPGKGRVCLVTT